MTVSDYVVRVNVAVPWREREAALVVAVSRPWLLAGARGCVGGDRVEAVVLGGVVLGAAAVVLGVVIVGAVVVGAVVGVVGVVPRAGRGRGARRRGCRGARGPWCSGA